MYSKNIKENHRFSSNLRTITVGTETLGHDTPAGLKIK